MTDARTRRDAGVTLVELMIVLVFVAIGILALSGVQTRSSRDVDAGGRRIRALTLAQNEMEAARADGYTNAASDSGTSGPFAWVARVDSIAPLLKRIRVTVSWTEKGAPQQVELDNMESSR